MTDIEIFANYIQVIDKYPEAYINPNGSMHCLGIPCDKCPSQKTCSYLLCNSLFDETEPKIVKLHKNYTNFADFKKEYPEYFI